MTPRAERIIKKINDLGFAKRETWGEIIDSEIREAVEEAMVERPLWKCSCLGKEKYVAELCRGCHCRIGYAWSNNTIKELKNQNKREGFELGFADGFTRAREMAAGICERKYEQVSARQIRALQMPEGK